MPPGTATELTLAGAQRTVDRWISTVGRGYFSRLTNLAMLAEEVGEVARIIARADGEQRAKASDDISDARLADELADVLWITLALANQSHIDISEAFVNNLRKKNIRDKERFAGDTPDTYTDRTDKAGASEITDN